MESDFYKYIDETMPWVLAKEEKTDELRSVMYHLMENLRKFAIMLKPAIENTSEEIFRQLGIEDQTLKSYDSIYKYKMFDQDIKVIEKGEPLFTRLDTETEIEYIKNEMKKTGI